MNNVKRYIFLGTHGGFLTRTKYVLNSDYQLLEQQLVKAKEAHIETSMKLIEATKRR